MDSDWDHSLATLSSIFDNLPDHYLLATLKLSNGNLDRAIDLCLAEQNTTKKRSLKQLEISSFVETKKKQKLTTHPTPPPNSLASSLKNLNDTLRWPSPQALPRPRKQPQSALCLYHPKDVEANTPCQLIFNALPKELADSLLRLMLDEAKEWRRNEWWLFERSITSPHTAGFYVAEFWRDSFEAASGGYDYNDAKIEAPKRMPPEMEQARQIAQQIVNQKMSIRERHPFEIPGEWKPNVAAANHYASSDESVGWHSDQLTHLGPRPTIASLSLGVTRQFRIRQILPTEVGRAEISGRMISIALPHNSLLIMDPPMQEEWKHEVPPQFTIDPHIISGNARINLTFRVYRPEYSPLSTPLCQCGVRCIFRPVQRHQQTAGRYFYTCNASKQQMGQSCNYFQWMDPSEKIKTH